MKVVQKHEHCLGREPSRAKCQKKYTTISILHDRLCNSGVCHMSSQSTKHGLYRWPCAIYLTSS